MRTPPFGNTFRSDHIHLSNVRSELGPLIPRHPDVATTKLPPTNFLHIEHSSNAAPSLTDKTVFQIESAYKFFVDGVGTNPMVEEMHAAVASSGRDRAANADAET